MVALRKVRLGIVRDVLGCLAYRKANGCVGGEDRRVDEENTVMTVAQADGEPSADAKSKDTTTTTTVPKEDHTKPDKIPQDLIDIWTIIESKIHQAELACSEVETPKELYQI